MKRRKRKISEILVFITLVIVASLFVIPVILVFMNSIKSNYAISVSMFSLPTKDTFVGFSNFIKGFTFGAYSFWLSFFYSFIITLTSVILILIATSMAAWFILRINNKFTRLIYYLCIFSMVVPFQMVMFTLSKTADTLLLNNPFTISIIYLGFGAGLGIFLFTGFMKSIPYEIEEAAAIDGCNPVQMFF
jgi:raffinose/stachyose/melibiose transport system permease protein